MTAMIESPLTDCKDCTNPIAPWDRFCNNCGVKTELGVATDPAAAYSAAPLQAGDTDPIGFAPIAAPPTPPAATNNAAGGRAWYAGRGAKLTAIAAASALAAGLLGFAASAYLENQSNQERVDATIATATQGLTTASADLGQVVTTEQIRAIAANAAAAGTALAEGTAGLEGEDAARAKSVQSALTAVAGLAALNTDTLDQWPTLRGSLKPALDSVNAGSDTVGVPGSDTSLATVDGLVARGSQAIAKWNSKNTAVKQKQAADLAAVNSYASQMGALITQYDGMRADTGRQLDKIRAVSFYETSTARTMFAAAHANRAEVRNQMNGLVAPNGIGSQHSNVASVVGDGMAGMNELIGALDSNLATCGITSCNLLDEPSWDAFQNTSDQVTRDFDSARDQLNNAINSRRDAIKDRQLPGKPVI